MAMPVSGGNRFKSLRDKLSRRNLRDPKAMAVAAARRKYSKARSHALANGR